MTTYEDVRAEVAGSAFHEWIAFPSRGVWTYQPDVQLRISREEQIDSRYRMPWTEQVQGGSARFGYYVYYADSPVEYHVVVSVDDGRAHVPEPQQSQQDGSFSISAYEATLGRIITGDAETFNAYLNRTNVGIRGD